jgi:hypothetical protein
MTASDTDGMRQRLSRAIAAELAELLDHATKRVGLADEVSTAAAEGPVMTLLLAGPGSSLAGPVRARVLLGKADPDVNSGGRQ